MPKSKPIHPCDKCESIATQIYPEYKLCEDHYREVNLIEVNKVFMEWISVKDRLPEIGEFVDIYVTGKGRMCDYEYETEGVFYNNDVDDTQTLGENPVTHWYLIVYPKKDKKKDDGYDLPLDHSNFRG
jgi:hypothetical protein